MCDFHDLSQNRAPDGDSSPTSLASTSGEASR